MKKIVTILAAVLLTVSVFAQAPQKMSYQAVIRNSSDLLVTNQMIGMEINIRQGSPSGTIVYTETQTPITNANGLVSIEIGIGAGFSNIDWASNTYYIETNTAVVPPLTTYTITGVIQLLSVPYALNAKTAESIIGGINETDPIFSASPSFGIVGTDISNWNTAYGWGNHTTAGYLTSFTEADPIYISSPASVISIPDISNWNISYSWGNHAGAGYLTSFTEADPLFGTSPASGISIPDISNWNTAFSWGDHANAGYLTSITETDPMWSVSPSFGISNTDITNWNTAYGWGNHAIAGYLTSFTEVDPEVGANSLNYISKWNGASLVTSSIFDNGNVGIGTITPGEKLDVTGNIRTEGSNTIIYGNNTGSSGTGYSFAIKLITGGQEKAKIEYMQESAYSTNISFSTRLGTGGFSSVYSEKMRISPAGNVGIGTTVPATKLDVNGVITATGGNSTNWNIAFGWGNHATAGYLTSFTETDPIFTNNFNFTGSATNDLLHFDGTKWVNFTPNYLTSEIQNLSNVLANGSDAGNNTIVNVSQQGIGTSTPNASAALEINSTTKGFLPPRMNDLQMLALTPVEGLIIYNTSSKLPVYYNGTEWRKIDGSVFLHVGKSYQGGIIAYILQPGDPGYIAGEVHGLIASPANLGSNISWGCAGTTLSGADGTALGTGNQNTIDIMAGCPTAGIAARLCGDLVIDVYGDWYLPSLDEMYKLYLNRTALSGWATYNVYWTSSEFSNFFAWRVNSTIGSPDTNNKSLAGFVRAVRSF